MNARSFQNFFKTKTGHLIAFFAAIFVIGALIYGCRVSSPQKKIRPKPTEEASQSKKTVERNTAVLDLPQQLLGLKQTPQTIPTEPPPLPLPLTLYRNDTPAPAISENSAPYGRLIPCETVITIDSAKIETPIIGFVTEDIYQDGRLIVPAGAEVHGKAKTDHSRERIASQNQWFIVWRTTDQLNGAELSLTGLALDMQRDYHTNTWAITDGSAGLRGDVIKTDNLAEIKLFASTFLGAAASGLQDTQNSFNPYTGTSQRMALDSPKNAALQGMSAVVNEYARQIAESIRRDGFYVRVPAGKQFYLYCTQTIDQGEARKGQTRDQKPKP